MRYALGVVLVKMRPGDARERLLADGGCFVSGERLCEMLGVTADALPASLGNSVAGGDFVKVCRGGWVARDDTCKDIGRPLPDLALYVDDMMRHLEHRYYLGFNAAAAAHGAAHRRFSNTVVVTSARTAHRTAAYMQARHRTSGDMMSVSYMYSADPHCRGFERRQMPKDFYPRETLVNYSTPEVTLLDMVWKPAHAGGLDQVATVALDLMEGRSLDPEVLAARSLTYPESVRQRTGCILDAAMQAGCGVPFDTGPLRAAISPTAAITALMPEVERFFPPAYDDTALLAVDPRWRVRINTLLDPDG